MKAGNHAQSNLQTHATELQQGRRSGSYAAIVLHVQNKANKRLLCSMVA
jgi:hypothetical protein